MIGPTWPRGTRYIFCDPVSISIQYQYSILARGPIRTLPFFDSTNVAGRPRWGLCSRDTPLRNISWPIPRSLSRKWASRVYLVCTRTLSFKFGFRIPNSPSAGNGCYRKTSSPLSHTSVENLYVVVQLSGRSSEPAKENASVW